MESVMSNVYRNDGLLTLVPPPTLKSDLIVRYKKGGEDGTKRKYEYYFEDNEILVGPGISTVEFTVNIKNPPKPIYKFRFFDHCSTQPFKVENPTGFMTATKIEDASVPSSAQPVRLTVKPDNKELIIIGLIVEIRYKDETRSDYVLCDPQVGNGPANSGGGTGGGGGNLFAQAWTFSAA
jgi:hypothetical protein